MKALDFLLDLIFPPTCICCKRALKHNAQVPFCKQCLALLESHKTFAPKQLPNSAADKCYCLYRYEEKETKGVIFHTKNIFSKSFGEFIAKELKGSLIDHHLINQIDVITFCPRKNSSVRKIGFDQGREISRYLSLATNIPYDELIIRKGKSKEQKFLDHKAREENVKGIFFFDKSKNISGKRVLLLDDVVTTGATIRACSKVLKENGAKSVYSIAIAD